MTEKDNNGNGEREEQIENEVLAAEQKRREKEQIGNEKGVMGAEIVEEMEQAFIDYAMSVIVDRALPSVEDGLKPVHRRILYGIWEARMKDGFHLPVLVKVSKFYNPGPMISLLHYASGENEGFVYPYQLNHRMSPQIIINPHDGKRRAMPRSIGGALRKYVKNLDTVSMQIFPKIVTIEEVLDRNKVIYEIDKTGLEKLEMEPQQ